MKRLDGQVTAVNHVWDHVWDRVGDRVGVRVGDRVERASG